MQFSSVQQRRRRDDGGAVLIVVHHRNIGRFSDSTFDFKALRRFDVLEIDATKRLGNVHHRLNEGFRVLGVHLNIKDVDASEGFEQKSLALHDGFARQRPYVSKAEDGRTVGDNSNQIPLGCVAIGVFGPLCDFQTRISHARRIRQTQFVRSSVRFRGYNLDFPARFELVVGKSFFSKMFFLGIAFDFNTLSVLRRRVFQSCDPQRGHRPRLTGATSRPNPLTLSKTGAFRDRVQIC